MDFYSLPFPDILLYGKSFYDEDRRNPYPVNIIYSKTPVIDYMDACVERVVNIHATQPSGSILVYLPSQDEVETCHEMLKDRAKGLPSELLIIPANDYTPVKSLLEITEHTSPEMRKVILVTEVSEPCMFNIIFVRYVIDTGFTMQKCISPLTGLDCSKVVPISKEIARQRADSTACFPSGKCYRLYPKWAYECELDENTIPEIQWTNLTKLILALKTRHIDDLVNFNYPILPPHETVVSALEQSYALGALNHRGELTKTGRQMGTFPTNPMMAKVLFASEKYKCSEEIVTIAAMLSINSKIYLRPINEIEQADTARKNFFHAGGDHLTLMNVYNQWAETDYSAQWCCDNFIQYESLKWVRDIRTELIALMKSLEIDMVSSLHEPANIKKAIMAGYFYHVARLSNGGNYKLVKHNETVMMHPNCALFEKQPRLVLFHELVYTTKEYMRKVIEIDSDSLLDVAPHYYNATELKDSTNEKCIDENEITDSVSSMEEDEADS